MVCLRFLLSGLSPSLDLILHCELSLALSAHCLYLALSFHCGMSTSLVLSAHFGLSPSLALSFHCVISALSSVTIVEELRKREMT